MDTSRYQEERETFSEFRSSLLINKPLQDEIILALTQLVTEYNTTIRENRFVVGGAVEHIIGSAMRACGITAFNRGQHAVNYDIELPSGVGFSCKAEFQESPTDIRIKNFLGESGKYEWVTPTILVVANLGIAYVDPDILPGTLKKTPDAAVLQRKVWFPFIKNNPQFLFKMPIPVNPRNEGTNLASYVVADEILRRPNYKLLRMNRTSVSN